MVKGIYAGVWDLLHPGHLIALCWAKHRCDHLTVALNVQPDHKARQPIETESERHCRLEGCKYVDDIVSYKGEAELRQIYATGKYQIAFISKEHQNNFTDPSPARPVFVPRNTTNSSTSLKKRIKQKV
ncbi:adenylyltransferase/cytidyltransferase family protein [Candidatus Poribacteria bacterium]|nr:adenylyltransferase/cytidyltransferase family protein [Candidatus Poribacteria bacterium]